MAKKKKTRREKMLADMRRQSPMNYPGVINSLENKTTAAKEESAQNSTLHTISTSEYQYLSRDLQKTMFLTGSIVIAELLLKFFIKGV